MATSNEKRSIFERLPPEIISRVLNFMDAWEYRGLPCTCHYALELVNTTMMAENPFLRDEPEGPEKSMTGKLFILNRQYRAEMFTSCEGYSEIDDPDL
jgi:hypothetical protein